MTVICSLCNKTFTRQSSLNRHLTQQHKLNDKNITSYDVSAFNSKCLECLSSFKVIKDLRTHLESIHNQQQEVVNLTFQNFGEFSDWLSVESQNNNVQYVVACGSSYTEGSEVKYYNCNRNVTKQKQAENSDQNVKKRFSKSQGTCKMEVSCTSQLKVVLGDKVYVTYHKTHYNHTMDLKHLRIPQEIRLNVANKLKAGVSKQKILDDTRDNIGGKKLTRSDLLTRKDVNNIKKSFDIHAIEEGRRHHDDAFSIQIWVQEQEGSENNAVLFYKKQGMSSDILEKEDFCLVIMNKSQQYMLQTYGHNVIAIDSTHGLNKYDFELTTLLVIDEFKTGFPAACMFTNRKDTYIFELFFNCIKNKIGSSISAKTFMSDITSVNYNAWHNIMGMPEIQLYCAWHVDRAWQTNLNKISNMDKKKWAYKTVKYLQLYMDESRFLFLLQNGIKELKSDAETNEFGIYFEKYYSESYKLWAYCFRKHCSINTNMHLEAMHKQLKYTYLDGKKVQRLDKGLHALLKFIRDKVVDRLIKNTKGQSTIHTQQIAGIHRHVVSNKELYSFTLISEIQCIVQMTNKRPYEVTKHSNIICCHLDCKFCHVCLHMYSCQCAMYYIQNTICEHIHYVAFNGILANNNISITSEGTLDNTLEMETHLSTLQNEKCDTTSTNDLQGRVKNTLEEISTMCSNVSDENTLKEVLTYLNRGKAIIKLSINRENVDIESNKENIPVEPSNKRILKQLAFRSTSKKIKKKHNYKKASEEEEQIIEELLLNNINKERYQ